MPIDPNGFLVFDPSLQGVPDEIIRSAAHNAALRDTEDAINKQVDRDGKKPMSGDLRMNDHKITGLKAGTAPEDAVTKAQLDGKVGRDSAEPITGDLMLVGTEGAAWGTLLFRKPGDTHPRWGLGRNAVNQNFTLRQHDPLTFGLIREPIVINENGIVFLRDHVRAPEITIDGDNDSWPMVSFKNPSQTNRSFSIELNPYNNAMQIALFDAVTGAFQRHAMVAWPNGDMHVAGIPYVPLRVAGVFNGANGTLLSSHMIASVSRLSVGRYRISFATPLPDSNYSVQLTVGIADNNQAATGVVMTGTRTNTSVEVATKYSTASSSGYADFSEVHIAIYR